MPRTITNNIWLRIRAAIAVSAVQTLVIRLKFLRHSNEEAAYAITAKNIYWPFTVPSFEIGLAEIHRRPVTVVGSIENLNPWA
jgi:hypothetical protein